jgi:putative ABC transport system permease protein
MLSNFFKIAFRNIARHKGFSFINIAGLTLGLTACIMIGLFVWDESQYDKSIPGSEQVYRVYDEYTDNEGTEKLAVSAPMFATALQQDFPEVEKTARVMMLAENKPCLKPEKNNFMKPAVFLLIQLFLMFSRFQ